MKNLLRLNQGKRLRLVLGVFALLACASTAHAWWDGEWTLRRKLTLDPAAVGVTPDAGGAVPVLIRLHDGNFRFASAKPDGADLRFIGEDDKTPLMFHLEKFDPVLNEAFAWVKVPVLKAGAKTTLYLYYGNAGNKAVKAENTKGTYDENTLLVYHFTEHGQPAYDFTAGGNNAQNSGLAADDAMIGAGLRLDGKTTITIPAAPSLAWTNGSAMTWSAWVKFGPPQPHAVFFSRRDGGKFFLIGADNGVPFVETVYQGGTVRTPAGPPVAPNGWQHVAVVAAGEKITLYVGGEVYATMSAALPALTGPMVVGGDGVGGLMNESGAGFSGAMDEMEISNVERSPAALKLAALSQGGDSAGKLLTLGEDEQETSWLSALKGGYIGVIIGSLTVDGWVVIGILALMSVISWWVMVRKALYLNSIGKGNEQFLAEWSHVATDLSVLDAGTGDHAKTMGGRVDAKTHRAMTRAPLYRIYHIGVEEIQHRLSADRNGSAKILSARSIQAIRATLDGGLVRETQKLSNSMVLLTIAISGGPFLGLLGTVVGVMITFAAVAQAGDVNVNAIAPGIAAALAATVAGLAVAIPALFGYNYLVTRIKGCSTDLHVFIDEFVTKLAEFYAEPVDALRDPTKAPFEETKH